MRLATHTGLVLALLISFSQAPHDHFHPGDSDHDHDHQANSHASDWHVDVSNEPILEAPDHDSTAMFKDWLAGDGSTPTKEYAETVSVVNTRPLLVLEHLIAVVSLNNHDPPSAFTQPARAPPESSFL